MSTLATTTVGNLVRRAPARARVFEQYGIDYCCGGKQPLADACRAKDLALEEILAQLEQVDAQASGTADPDSMSMTELCDHIEATHHQWLRRELPRLDGLLAKVQRAHGDRHAWLAPLRQTFDALVDELTPHMAKEEQVLFPMLRAMEAGDAHAGSHCGGIQNPISVMEFEHDNAGNALARMHELTNGYVPPAEACNTFRALLSTLAELELDLHTHIHKENNILFPKAIQAAG